MPVATIKLTDKEKQVFYLAQKVPFVTAKSVTSSLPITYTSATRFLNSLQRKGFLIKGPYRGEEGYPYRVPKEQQSGNLILIPFNGENYPLADLLLYITQELPENDFTKYGRVISASVHHLLFRALQLQEGNTPVEPTPSDVRKFLWAALKPYKDTVAILESVLELPIFEDSEEILHYFDEVNESYLNEREVQLFIPYWRSGVASVRGLRGKFKDTLNKLKEEHFNKYGKAEKL